MYYYVYFNIAMILCIYVLIFNVVIDIDTRLFLPSQYIMRVYNTYSHDNAYNFSSKYKPNYIYS